MNTYRLNKGFVQVYTGDGKGKTTAALGLALRAAGSGLRVYIGQFIKGCHYSELNALERFDDLISIKQYGRGCFIYREPEEEDIEAARAGLEDVIDVIQSGAYDVVILDEANCAVDCGLFAVGELLNIIDEKPNTMELLITGRNAAPDLLQRADLVTEMCAVSHYYERGVQARKGIEK